MKLGYKEIKLVYKQTGTKLWIDEIKIQSNKTYKW